MYEKNKQTIDFEEKVKVIISFFSKKTQADGRILLDMSLKAFCEKFHICVPLFNKIISIYYDTSKKNYDLLPKVRGFKLTEQIFLKEFRYQNILLNKKYRDNSFENNFNVVFNTKNKKLEIVPLKDLKSNHNILATAQTIELAEKRWKELAEERVAKIC